MRRAAAAALALAVLAGCGAESPGAGERSSRLVDFSQKPPFVNALEVDARSGEYLLTTNRGFFRIDPESDRVREVRSTVRTPEGSSPVGTFLFLTPRADGTLIGSGHPDDTGALPNFLGFIQSRDDGRTWRVLARLGEADLHKIIERHDRLYAWDAVLGALLVSRDGGRTFDERFTPRGLIIDIEVDPADPDRVLAASEQQLFRSTDQGEGWRGILGGEGIRLAWPAPDALYRAEKDGAVYVSPDGGDSWEKRAAVEGEPYKFHALGPQRLLLALSDGTIFETTDGARSWDERFRP